MVNRLRKLWEDWGDELTLVLASFGLLALISLIIELVAGPDAAPYDIIELQHIVLTYAKFSCFSIFAWVNVWAIGQKFTGPLSGQSPYEDTWAILRVYFASLGLLVLLHFT